MTRGAILRGLKRQLMNHVRPGAKPAVTVLFAAIEDQWAAIMSNAETEAYNRGVRLEQERQASSEKSGFQMGYQHGLERAIGHTGSPARRLDDDDLTISPS